MNMFFDLTKIMHMFWNNYPYLFKDVSVIMIRATTCFLQLSYSKYN